MTLLDAEARDIARAALRIDEATRAKPYRCPAGKLTVGVGRNLEDRGLRPDEIALMLENDIADAEADARALFPSFDRLSALRRAVLINMAFNLGRDRLARFARMRAALEAQDYARAAAEMLDSKWASDVGSRAQRLAQEMIQG